MSKNQKKLVVFLIPPEEQVSGGIMSIFSLCRESRTLLTKDTDVVISTFPGTKSYSKNTLFRNDEIIYDFSSVLNRLPNIASLTLHIPEYAIERVTHSLLQYHSLLEKIDNFSINILNQNMELMPNTSIVAGLHALSPIQITQTTAHERYTTQELSDQYNTPVLNFSVFLDTSQYKFTSYEQKENIIAYSNDQNPNKDAILKRIHKELPDYALVEITNLSYEDYKNLITKSKYILTFGEGFDGYLIEGIFSGSITFAVYNDTFFSSKDFLKYENIYGSYQELSSRIATDIRELDNAKKYQAVNRKNFTTLSKIYDRKIYLNNLQNFYSNKFTFLPKPDAARKYFSTAILDRDMIIEERNRTIYNKDLTLQSQAQGLDRLNSLVQELEGQLVVLKEANRSQKRFIEKVQNTLTYRVFKKLSQLKKSLNKFQ